MKIPPILTAMALAVCTFVFFSACGGQNPDPETTVRNFLKAQQSYDLEGMAKYMPDDRAAKMREQNKALSDEKREKMKAAYAEKFQDAEVEIIGTLREGEDKATVTYVLKRKDKKPVELKQGLRRLNGKWVVDYDFQNSVNNTVNSFGAKLKGLFD